METTPIPNSSTPTNPFEEPKTNPLSVQVRHYFLDQGQKIGQLYQLLDRGYYRAYLSRAIYWLIEIILYGVFIMGIVAIFRIHSEITTHIYIDGKNSVGISYTNDDLTDFILFLRLVLFAFSTLPLLLARAIRRSRKKTQAIQASFKIIEEMKENFDKAVKDLKL
jgi:hypothetical protein